MLEHLSFFEPERIVSHFMRHMKESRMDAVASGLSFQNF